jgi:superfamily II DNA/RNA helicase
MTQIQSEAIPLVSDGRDIVLKSETGSGKTLAYMVPLINSLIKEEV